MRSDTRTGRRQRLFAVITVSLSILVALAAAEMLLDYQRQRIEGGDRMDPGMILYDPQLGWRLAPRWSGQHQNYDFSASYSIDRFGNRADPAGERAGGRRYAVVGDSFSFGIGVDDGETFSAQLNAVAADGRRFLNFSVPGYSTDQQYLQVRDRLPQFAVDEVLLVVYLANDLFDNLRPFPLQAEYAKPWFSLASDGALQLHNSPVPRRQRPAAARQQSLSSIVLGDDIAPRPAAVEWLAATELFRRLGLLQREPQISDEIFARRFAPALQLFNALVGQIRSAAAAQGATLTVALLPGHSYITRPGSLSARYQEFLRQAIVDRLAADESIQLIDLATALRGQPGSQQAEWYFPNEGHLTPDGHRQVAAILQQQLR